MNQSTIEAFATAVDAKDQVTHGHIRRVQSYCLALARDLGADDEPTLKALEAAALLHDVGKIGIPEHILNKPGKLTPAEFEVMKRHVAIGADICPRWSFRFRSCRSSRITTRTGMAAGYPDGVRGEEIPLGARILSVVDCFDALTSDRPVSGRDVRRGRVRNPARAARNHVRPGDRRSVHRAAADAADGATRLPLSTPRRHPRHPRRLNLRASTRASHKSLVDMLAAALPNNLCVAYEIDVKSASVVATATAGPGAAGGRPHESRSVTASAAGSGPRARSSRRPTPGSISRALGDYRRRL